MALLYRERAQTEAALNALACAVDLLEALVADFPATPRYRCDLAIALRERGQLLLSSDRTVSRRSLEAAQKHLEKLVESSPEDKSFVHELEATRQQLRAIDESAEGS